MKKLNSLQTNAEVLEQIRRSRGRLARNNLPEMRSFTERAGVKVSSSKSFFFYLCTWPSQMDVICVLFYRRFIIEALTFIHKVKYEVNGLSLSFIPLLVTLFYFHAVIGCLLARIHCLQNFGAGKGRAVWVSFC